MPREKVKINVKEKLEDNLLDLSLLEISEVPVKDIAALKRATILDLSNNKITFLGKNFATLNHITKLDLGKNEIKFLPENFGELTNLRHLDLYNNKLEHLPLSFGNLTKLRYLDLKGNPLDPVLHKVVGPCLSSKDCSDAAKKVIPFMQNLEREVKAEQQKRQEEEKRLREEEEAKRVSEEKAAKKKQVKKEKQQRDKLKKRESENQKKSEEPGESEEIKENGETPHELDLVKPTQSRGFLFRFIKFIVLLSILLALFSLLSMKFLPKQADKVLDLLPIQQKIAVKSFYDNVNLLIKNYFEKIPNLYKIK